MKKDVTIPEVTVENLETVEPSLTASEAVHKFLLEHKIAQKLTILDDKNSWVGDGVVLNDKPLLKITYQYKD